MQLPESENESITAYMRELAVRRKRIIHRCIVYASLDSGYRVYANEIKACRDDGCSFCMIIMNSMNSRSWGFLSSPMNLRLEHPGNAIRLTGGGKNLEIYRSAEGQCAYLLDVTNANLV